MRFDSRPNPRFKLSLHLSALLLLAIITANLYGPALALIDDPPISCPEGSMKTALEVLDARANVPRRILVREPDAVIQRMQNFQCTEFEKLPDALTIKWSGQPYVPSRRRFRQRRSDADEKAVYHHNSYERRFDDSFQKYQPLPPMKALSFPNPNIRGTNAFYYTNSDQNHRRKLTRRKSRQAVKPVGYPSNEIFAEVIPRLPKKSQHEYIPLGSEAILRCFSAQDEIEEGSWLDRKFKWLHSDGREVSAPEVHLNI
jgi:hypothetical protein